MSGTKPSYSKQMSEEFKLKIAVLVLCGLWLIVMIISATFTEVSRDSAAKECYKAAQVNPNISCKL